MTHVQRLLDIGYAKVVLVLALLAIVGMVAANGLGAAPSPLSAKAHEGQLSDGSYSKGNITTYPEGSLVNYRCTLEAAEGAHTGAVQVRFSGLEADGCLFFTGNLVLGAWTQTSGDATPLQVTAGAPAIDGDEWVVLLDIDVADHLGKVDYLISYALQLTDSAGECSGSSQHTRLASGSANVGQTGAQNVPVPANKVIELPDITVTKMIDRDGDGTFESTASQGEYAFTLDGSLGATTDANGQVVFPNIQPDGDHTVTEQQVLTNQGTYMFVSGSGDSNVVFAGATATVTVAAGTTATNGQVQFNNGFAGLTLNKANDADGSELAGDTITYSYTATNAGSVPLTGLSLSDDIEGALSLSTTDLGVGESATASSPHSVTQAEVDAGSLTNVATVVGTDPSDNELSAQDTNTVTFVRTASISLDKSNDASGVGQAGSSDTYSFLITNTGTVTVSTLTLLDDVEGAISLSATSLAPGETASGTATHVITQANVNNGSLTNNAVADAGHDLTALGVDAESMNGVGAVHTRIQNEVKIQAKLEHPCHVCVDWQDLGGKPHHETAKDVGLPADALTLWHRFDDSTVPGEFKDIFPPSLLAESLQQFIGSDGTAPSEEEVLEALASEGRKTSDVLGQLYRDAVTGGTFHKPSFALGAANLAIKQKVELPKFEALHQAVLAMVCWTNEEQAKDA